MPIGGGHIPGSPEAVAPPHPSEYMKVPPAIGRAKARRAHHRPVLVMDGGPLDVPHVTLAQQLWAQNRGGYDDNDGFVGFAEVRAAASRWAAALHAAGIEKGDRVAILGETSRAWKIADHAIHAIGAVVVPIYPTLQKDQVAYILQDAGAKAVFLDEDQAPKVPDASPSWRLDAQPPEAPDLDVDPLVAAGSPDDLALIIYTSGTTGTPKGVALTHHNLVGDVAGTIEAFELGAIRQPSIVAFLPLAHVAGYVSLAAMVPLGATVRFSSPRSMAADLASFRPTIALAVPRLWERIVRKVEEAVAEAPRIRQALYARAKHVAQQTGHAMQTRRPSGWLAVQHRFFDLLVYKKIRKRLGFDRVSIAITGAAAMRADLLCFLQGMGIPIVEGYGMTETSALSVATRPDAWRAGTVGTPLPGVRIRIEDDEVLIGGFGVFQEYWGLPKETAATRVLRDGEPWVRSGDVGKIDEAGNLAIVDRIKELEKLDTGKFVVPTRVEELLKAETPLVEDSCTVAHGRKFAALLIQPAYDALLSWAANHGVRPREGSIIRQMAPTGEEQTYGITDPDFLGHPTCLLYTSPSPRDGLLSRMPSSA